MQPQGPEPGQPGQPHAQLFHPGYDFKTQLEQRPWLDEDSDKADYFNYNFNEQSFLQFINRQIRKQLQRERDEMLRSQMEANNANRNSTAPMQPPNHGYGGGHHHNQNQQNHSSH